MRLPNNLEIAVFAYNRPSHLRRVLISLEDYKIKKINLFANSKGKKKSVDYLIYNGLLFLKSQKKWRKKIIFMKELYLL